MSVITGVAEIIHNLRLCLSVAVILYRLGRLMSTPSTIYFRMLMKKNGDNGLVCIVFQKISKKEKSQERLMMCQI